MADRETFEYESLHDAASIASHLQALADGLKQGRLSLASNGKVLLLKPVGLLQLSVEGRKGKHRSRLLVKVQWRDDTGDDERGDPLRIGAGSA